MFARARSIDRHRVAIVLLCAGIISSCHHRSPPSGESLMSPPQHFTGYYAWGPERSAFVPCADASAGERWWVFLPDVELSARDSLVRAAPPPDSSDISSSVWFIEFDGWRGPVEPTGHLGLYNRIVRVNRIHGLRRASSQDCGGSIRALQVFKASPPPAS